MKNMEYIKKIEYKGYMGYIGYTGEEEEWMKRGRSRSEDR